MAKKVNSAGPGDVITSSLNEVPAQDQKWRRCNGRQLRKLAGAGLAWLERNYQHVNALNVFPVPDGDTGTNMLLTMRSAYARIQANRTSGVGEMARELSQGALMGARGNSGVILSQIWRGFAHSLDDKKSFTTAELAAAIKESAGTAYKGVMRPIEGTMLTVIREGAEEAVDAAAKSDDLRFVLERVVERCQQSLERTPELLPILRQAGVVDAGGQGLVYLLEGMLRFVHGELAEDLDYKPAGAGAKSAQALAAPAEGLDFPYDVQFILTGDVLSVLDVRHAIDAMGDSTVVVGDERMIKVHVHVKDPGVPLSYGVTLGNISDVVVENMQLQMEAIIESGVTPASPAPANRETGDGQELGSRLDFPTKALSPEAGVQPGQIGVVAVAAGEGLARIFRSLNADAIVAGGPTNNPSTEEILQAIQALATDKVIVLANDKNIILAAEAARGLSPKEVIVVPTRSVPQGISALCRLVREGALDEVATAMAEASKQVSTGEITLATRSVTLNGVKVESGELIGLANDLLCASGSDMAAVLRRTLEAMAIDERELISIYYGRDVNTKEALTVQEQVRTLYPQVEVELLPGGQAHYFYILGAE